MRIAPLKTNWTNQKIQEQKLLSFPSKDYFFFSIKFSPSIIHKKNART